MEAVMRVAAVLAVAGLPATRADNRLKIKNECMREPLWIAHMAGATTGPDMQDIKIDPGQEHAFKTPPGLTATRYWPKMGCDVEGKDCTLGGSGGPGERCVKRGPGQADDYSACGPPIDTKFEGTFGSQALPCKDGVGVQGCDYVDVSLVDGWTLPFVLKVYGNCVSAKGPSANLVVDCSGLTFSECPTAEKLTAAGNLVTDLRAINPSTGQVAGCYAPCQRLVSEKWNNTVSVGRKHWQPEVAPYCCPTPPETPEMCRTGPMVHTQFLNKVHGKCPGVYGYAYDDGMGLMRCEPNTVYEMIFKCPDEQTNFLQAADAKRKRQAEQEVADAQQQQQKAAVARAAATGSLASLAAPKGLDRSVQLKSEKRAIIAEHSIAAGARNAFPNPPMWATAALYCSMAVLLATSASMMAVRFSRRVVP